MKRSTQEDEVQHMVARDFTEILKDAPEGEWIALSSKEDRIVATAGMLGDAIALANERGEPNPVVMKVHSELFIPSVWMQTDSDQESERPSSSSSPPASSSATSAAA
jgi:hypothetical protein